MHTDSDDLPGDDDTEEFGPAPDRSPWLICGLCRGDGHYVNPAIDCGGLSSEDLDDEDFRDDYMNGRYDVPCQRCAGSGKVRQAELEAILARESERADERRLAAREDGDVEGFYGAGDARWG